MPNQGTAKTSNQQTSNGPIERTAHRSCFNCNEPGHLSRECTQPKTVATLRGEEKGNSRATNSNTATTTPRPANCFLRLTGGNLAIVDGLVNNRPVWICLGIVANVSIVSRHVSCSSVEVLSWFITERTQVLDKIILPPGVTTVDMTVGTMLTILQEIVVSKIPQTTDESFGSE